MMYDAENLYIALQWKDPVPMGNAHDPKTSNAGWAGDSVQLRLITDKSLTVTAWYYEPTQEPCLFLEYGKGDTSFGAGSRQVMQVKGWTLQEGAEMAFRKDADGKGYVQEIKLPWALITGQKRYEPGESFTCGMELLWGESLDNSVLKRMADNVRPGALPADETCFYLSQKEWGAVTLEKAGHLQLPSPAWAEKIALRAHAGPLSIAPFRGGADAAVSLTFDDGSQNQYDVAVPILNDFKMKGTFFVVSGVVRDKKEDPRPKGASRSGNGGLSWEELRVMSGMGHEIANHSLTHKGLIGVADPAILDHEINDSAKLIEEKIGQPPISFCYPGNGRDGAARAVVLQHHILDRRYCSSYGGAPAKFTLATANGYVDEAIKDHTWMVPMIHGIEEGYSPLDHETLRQHLQYIQSQGDRVWVETFGNIARYQHERDAAILGVIAQGKKKVTFTLTAPGLAPAIYNFPLTVIIPTPRGRATNVTAKRKNGTALPVKTQDGHLLVDMIPGVEPITVNWK